MPIDPAKSKLAAEYKLESPLLSCAFDPAGRFLFGGGRSRELVLVDTTSGQKSSLSGHESWIGVMARAGADMVLTGDYAGRVIAWDCGGKAPRQQWSIAAHPSTIYALSVSADGKTFATGDREGSVRIWQTRDGKLLHELPRIEYQVYGVALHPDGARIVTADRQPQKPRIKVWDIASAKEQRAIEVGDLSGYRHVEDIEWGGIRGLTLSPDGKLIVACGRTGYDGPASALLFELGTGKFLRMLSSTLKGGFYYSARFHPQGFLVTAGGDIAKGEFRCWDPEKDESIAGVSTPGPCMGLDIHPNGGSLVVAQAIGKRSYPESGTLTIY